MGCPPDIEIRLIPFTQGGDRPPGDGWRTRLGALRLILIITPRTDHAEAENVSEPEEVSGRIVWLRKIIPTPFPIPYG